MVVRVVYLVFLLVRFCVFFIGVRESGWAGGGDIYIYVWEFIFKVLGVLGWYFCIMSFRDICVYYRGVVSMFIFVGGKRGKEAAGIVEIWVFDNLRVVIEIVVLVF